MKQRAHVRAQLTELKRAEVVTGPRRPGTEIVTRLGCEGAQSRRNARALARSQREILPMPNRNEF